MRIKENKNKYFLYAEKDTKNKIIIKLIDNNNNIKTLKKEVIKK